MLQDYDKKGIMFSYRVEMNKHSMFRSYRVTPGPLADYYNDRPYRYFSCVL